MKRELLASDEYYHICGRGNLKQDLFHSNRDYLRFLFTVLYFQSDERFYNISRRVDYFEEKGSFLVSKKKEKKVLEDPNVKLLAFCLMPNHYHLIVKNISDNGISDYMQRVLTGFSRYSHAKYDASGHVFDGSYNLIHISSDEQLQYLFSYVHKNPKELPQWQNNYWDYPWSSCKDFAGNNRWGRLLNNEIITDQFVDFTAYRKFLKDSIAKEGFELPAI